VRKFTLRLLLAAMIALLLAGCGTIATFTATTADGPEFLRDASELTRSAYEFATEHHHDLEQYPCYCGCGPLGHLSSRDCFIKDISKAGEIVYDDHAAGCGICVLIALDVKKLMAEGKTPRQIRTFIDEKYSVYGPGTDTPPVS
jgi:uncharacterized protein YceK